MLPATIQYFNIGPHRLKAFIPDEDAVKEYYEQNKKNFPFPYWAKIWPASIGLCNFLIEHPHYIKNKKVLELAAGLGLPSLLAAKYAKEVYCSDNIPDSVELIQRSVEHNGLQNIECGLLDWNDIQDNLSADVLLLSDINYDPAAFNELYSTLTRFLNKGTTIILSTPQRLTGKDFIARLLPFCIQCSEEVIEDKVISIFVLNNR